MESWQNDEVWLRQEGESEAAYHAFELYRDMQPHRSLRALADKLTVELAEERARRGAKRGASAANPKTVRKRLERWSTAYHWQMRVRLFDQHVDRETIGAMVQEHRELLRAIRGALSVPIAALIELHRQEPMLTQRLAMGLLNGETRLLKRYEQLLRLAVVAIGGGILQIIEKERLVNGMNTANVTVGEQEPEEERMPDWIANNPAAAAAAQRLLLIVEQDRQECLLEAQEREKQERWERKEQVKREREARKVQKLLAGG